MAGIEMRFNGRKITSAAQLQRELTRSVEKHVEDNRGGRYGTRLSADRA